MFAAFVVGRRRLRSVRVQMHGIAVVNVKENIGTKETRLIEDRVLCGNLPGLVYVSRVARTQHVSGACVATHGIAVLHARRNTG